MKHLIVGIDGSDGARAAAEEAVELAAELRANVTFVCVLSAPRSFVGDPLYQHVLSDEIENGRTALAEAVDLADAAGVAATAELVEGDAPDALLLVARSRGADLIVVGSRGLGSIRGALLGSVSRAVTKHAELPVLVVKREAARRGLAPAV
jgi:nucleotide-binding universal stress UspA family protein